MAKRALLYALALVAVAPLTAQEQLNADINAKIRQEEAGHSQIMCARGAERRDHQQPHQSIWP